MIKALRIPLCIIAVLLLLAACDVIIEDGNLKVRDNGSDIVSIGKGGFRLDGNVTGVSLDGDGLRIEYPNGSLNWGGEGFDIKHDSGTLRIADGRMIVTDKEGKQQVLDTTGGGAEYRTEDGVQVGTGEKAALPEDYPREVLPLPDGFELDATALLGSVDVVNGHVGGMTVDGAAEYYDGLMASADSFHREKKAGSVLLRANLDGIDFTVYLFKSLNADAVNVCVVVGGK